MVRRACLAIGVSTITPHPNQAMRFAYLDGAVLAARALGEWAMHSGFGVSNVKIVDDGRVAGRDNPVTRERVQQAVDELFPQGADAVTHLILAFCGHGLTDSNVGAISWLFSDSLRMKYRVVADQFYTELLLHAVERITMITDACREAPKDINLMRLDAVRGIIIQGTQVTSPKFDRLAACQDGQLGYMVSDPMSSAPGKCIFSGVITDALWGMEPAAIADGRITTTTLGACVRLRTSERAQEYRLDLNPQCLVDPEPVILYDTARPLPKPTGLQPWPPAGAVATLGRANTIVALGDAERNLERVRTDSAFRNRILGSNFGVNRNELAAPAAQMNVISFRNRHLLQNLVALRQPTTRIPGKKQKVKALVKRLEAVATADVRRSKAAEVRRRLFQINIPSGANLVVWGERARVLSRYPIQHLQSTSVHVPFRVKANPSGTPVLVQLADGRLTPVVPYDNLYAVVVPSTTGDIYHAYGVHDFRSSYLTAVKAISAFAGGRIGADRVDDLAGRLRREKHADPALGALCAYLYRAIADYDGIRRMAYFYFVHGQPVPFDIALLGAMQVTQDAIGGLQLHIPAVMARDHRDGGVDLPSYVTQATPAVQASIGGRCPWLGLGWDYIKEPQKESATLVEGLAEHANMIRRSGFTVLSKKSGRMLASAWNLLH